MRLGLQPLGQLADGCLLATRETLDMQQQVLQWRNAFTLRSVFRETLEPPHLVTELGQRFKILFGQDSACSGVLVDAKAVIGQGRRIQTCAMPSSSCSSEIGLNPNPT